MKRSEHIPLSIAICGHIDHGKSTLIGRLLLDTKSLPQDRIEELKKISKAFGQETQIAYLSDQLKEERERNITIETTQHFIKTPKSQFVLIDTPGHVEFITNMLTGASHADAAILLIDATEGIQEQTRRHAYLLNFLSIEKVVVVVNKMDLVNYSQNHFLKLQSEVTALFQTRNWLTPTVIPASAKQGENIIRASLAMRWYTGPSLLAGLESLYRQTKQTQIELRFPIQDVYSSETEPVYVGRILSGQIKIGQELTVLPSRQTVVVNRLNIFNEKRTLATAGENIGLILRTPQGLKRGDILCTSTDLGRTTSHILSRMIWLHSTPLQLGQPVCIRCSTQTISASAVKMTDRMDSSTFCSLADENILKQNETAIVEFDLTQPAVFESFKKCPELSRLTIENENGILAAGRIENLS